MQVGDLVTFRGSIGLVMGKVGGKNVPPTDVWVLWNDEPNARWECGLRLEKICK